MSVPRIVKGILVLVVCVCAYEERREWRRSCSLPKKNKGTCLPIDDCQPALKLLEINEYPELCHFNRGYPIVCCPESKSAPVVAITGKSQEKCREYSKIKKDVNFPVDSNAIIAGVTALPLDFPHMAALGFGSEDNIQWQCGGSLISDTFILTAAHCVNAQEFGLVQFVRLGDLNLITSADDLKSQEFKVVQRITHPEYAPPSQYHDIALLQLDRAVEFSDLVKPACLYLSKDINDDDVSPIATGWGSTEFGGDRSAELKKVQLQFFSFEQCRQTYGPQRQLEEGLLDDLQICAGSVDGNSDTCQGDSGGPLQIHLSENPLMNYIVGVTSFGKTCGVANTPAVYTRVSNYIAWIEENVWSN